jgi:transcriptional regulator
MYVPRLFAETDPAAIAAIISAARICQFVTATPDGPLATMLPMYFVQDEGEHGTLYGHFARANTHWKQPILGHALAIFMGVDAYISPSWYAAKAEHGKVVPTWNYESVQAFGKVEYFEDASRLLEVVTRLTDQHESGRAHQWRVTDAPADYIESELRGIVGIRLSVSRLIAKRKLSQNKNQADKNGVAEGLSQGEREGDRRMACMISRTP